MCSSDKREEWIIQKMKSLQYLMSEIARVSGTAISSMFVMLMWWLRFGSLVAFIGPLDSPMAVVASVIP